ncbi:MAG: universal stress protein [Gammaproteobacteria bacterium]|nr:MAG: universal stress protein [Gammaproteobacteria bacterium]
MAGNGAIVFPTDFSEESLAALPLAKRMAAVMDAQLHCVYIVEEPHIYATLDMGPVPIPTAKELATTARERLERFAAEHLVGLDKPPVTKVLIGRPAEEIVDYARSIGADMIVMSTHGYSGVKHMILGSTTEAVLRHAECPVLSVRVK